MSVGNLFRSSYLLYFSQPAAERALYRAVHGQAIRSIVELGIDPACRTRRLLEVAGWRRENLPLRYTAIDLFEARPAGQSALSLKQAHAQLRRPDVMVQLVPGDPPTALARVANSLSGTDLLLISAGQNRASLAAAWSWIPRMLKCESIVLWEEPASGGQTKWRRVLAAEIQRMALEAGKLRRQAA